MDYSTFEALPGEKKKLILNVCIEEFSENGYENASTNRMVKKINISKGSLFKYFNTKEELYIYVIDYVVNHITEEITKSVKDLPTDIFERLCVLAEIEFDLYIKKPIFYRLFKQAFDGRTCISKQLIEKYSVTAGVFFTHAFQDIEFGNMKYDKDHILNLIKWFLMGYNEDFMNINANKIDDVNTLKKEYLKGIQMYITMIKLGVDK